MYERRRDPPPPRAICLYCGWSGIPNHNFLRDEHGGVSLILSEKPCPRCGRQTTQLAPPPPVPIQLIQAVRDAKLTPDELTAIADAIREAPEGLSPRDMAQRVPAASSLITVASRIGEKWVELLVIAITLVVLHVQTTDAERAHQDAERAHEDARQAHEDAERAHTDSMRELRNTSELSEDDISRIVEKLEVELRERRK